MRDQLEVAKDIQWLSANCRVRDSKYIRNLNRYNNNGARREDLRSAYAAPQAYVISAQGSDGVQTQLNVCRSAVDTVTSKISQATVRPFYSPNNGDYETRKACRAAQDWFDAMIDDQKLHQKAALAFRDAMIFDVGHLYIDPISKTIEKINPWEYFADPGEFYHDRVSRCMVQKWQYPLIALKERITNDELLKKLEKKTGWFSSLFKLNRYSKNTYTIYYDLEEGYRYEYFGADLICDPMPLEFERNEYGLMKEPVLHIWLEKPVRGFFGVSLIDLIYPIQRQIDELTRRLDAATRNAIFNIVFLPRGAGVKASDLENGAAKVYTYDGGPDGGVPQILTPPAIHPQFIELLRMYMEQAYQLAGISQLSAQSKKPAGLDSGVALQTFEDIESERWNTQVQNYVHFLVEVARRCVDIWPKGEDVLPSLKTRANVKWSDVKRAKDKFTIQFSAASSLSRDPSTKLEQIQQLIGMGYVDQDTAASLLQLPDLNGAYSLATSAYDYVSKIIERAVEDQDFDYVETANLELLERETVKKINQLEAADDDRKYINNAIKLLEKVRADLETIGGGAIPPPPVPPAQNLTPPPGAPIGGVM